jgi:hypothetical protein
MSPRALKALWVVWLVCLLSASRLVAKQQQDDDVAGPVVKLTDVTADAVDAPMPADAANATSHNTIAQIIDKALQKEFKDDTDKAETDVGKSFNETAKNDDVRRPLAALDELRRAGCALPRRPRCLPTPPRRWVQPLTAAL